MQKARGAHTLVHIGRAGVGRVDRYRHVGMVTEPNVQIEGSGGGRLEEGGSQVKSQLRDPNKSSQRRTAVG